MVRTLPCLHVSHQKFRCGFYIAAFFTRFESHESWPLHIHYTKNGECINNTHSRVENDPLFMLLNEKRAGLNVVHGSIVHGRVESIPIQVETKLVNTSSCADDEDISCTSQYELLLDGCVAYIGRHSRDTFNLVSPEWPMVSSSGSKISSIETLNC